MYGKKAENFYTDCYQYVNSTVALPGVLQKAEQFKEKQKRNFDKSHKVNSQPQIPVDTRVWITSERETIPGRVVANAGTPRSYVVETSRGEIERNRKHLNVDPSQADQSSIGRSCKKFSESHYDSVKDRHYYSSSRNTLKAREMWFSIISCVSVYITLSLLYS